ncbi:retrovirus-related Pol polyprotein from transposon 297 [Trichonephila clavipes]|uniref:Retrovirus-related Pol polyprotein from transposon 297 n=1 Tax=Trichonephila clavipes TaxID=2585209 RepID=A0A8X6VD30_TRICX|nr:retrovirus-related Pol polyprotein from transposon 297 [Trichonephila clavipes]
MQSLYASPVMLCRRNNGLLQDNPEAYRFTVDYRKLNAITKYPRYLLPLIDDFIMNTPRATIKSSLHLRSGYFQLAVSPSDIVKMGGLRNEEWYVRIPAYAVRPVRGGSQLSEGDRHYFETGGREVCECIYG